jgi:RNA polymerase sigma factor (sigma-70 family)
MNEPLETLQKRARNGDPQAESELFEALRARFGLFVRQRIGSRDDGEDIVQEALRTVFEKYRAIDFETSFAGWAYTVLTNKILTHARAARVRQEKHQLIRQEQTEERMSDELSRLEPRLLDCLRKLHAVNKRHARLVNLSYQGYSVEEICRRMNLTRTNLYTILSRARTALQECLDEGGAD